MSLDLGSCEPLQRIPVPRCYFAAGVARRPHPASTRIMQRRAVELIPLSFLIVVAQCDQGDRKYDEQLQIEENHVSCAYLQVAAYCVDDSALVKP